MIVAQEALLCQQISLENRFFFPVICSLNWLTWL